MAYILMIDDNPQSRRYLERIIRHRSPHQIAFAATGQLGIEQLVQRRPDVVFLDLFLPDMDGFQLFDQLRRHPATRDIPIVVHSAVPLDPLTRLRLDKLRCEGFVEFPVEASELNRVVAIALKRSAVPTRKWVPPSI